MFDSLFKMLADQINNEIGRNYGIKYQNLSRNDLAKKLLEDHTKNKEYRNKLLN